MSDINRVILTGRTASDIVLKKTASGNTVGNFRLAVSGKKDETIFVNCQLWGVVAENFAKFVGKGSKIGIDGRLNISQYEKDGQKRILVEVIGENVSWESLKKPGQKSGEDGSAPEELKESPNVEALLESADDLLPF